MRLYPRLTKAEERDSCISAVSAREYHFHLVCISIACVHVIAPNMFCIKINDEAASSQVATDCFPEQKMIINGSKK